MVVTRSQSRSRVVEEQSMILFKSKPLHVVYYSLIYICKLLFRNIISVLGIAGIGAAIYFSEHEYIDHVKFNIYWFLLGIASSIGFGSGLHTFLIYLGPHIVHVTQYSQKCGLPASVSYNLYHKISMKCNKNEPVEFYEIFLAIFINAFCWGVGTAVGELPPYFIARTDHKAKEELLEIQLLLKKKSLTTVESIKVNLYKLMKNYGFLGILLCASIPNPLFDLAGVLCGHFMIPFLTFVSATFIGKALFKASIQSVFMIGLFKKEIIEVVLQGLNKLIPSLHSYFVEILEQQKSKFDRQPGEEIEENDSIIGKVWNTLILLMILYFVVGFLETLANWELEESNKKQK